MANRKVTLLWYCKTEKGWMRYPVVMGANGRIKHGYTKAGHYPEGRYELRLYQGDKPIYKRAGAHAADALAARDREVHLLTTKDAASKAGVKVIEEAGRLYLRKAAQNFEEDAKNRQALEAAEVNRLVTEEFIAVTGLTYADEVTRDHVFRFHKALRKRGLGDRTVANKHARLRSFLRYCKLDYTDILPPAPTYEKKDPTIYTVEQVDSILCAADGYMRLAIELGLMCGLRDQELMHLEWADIDWAESTLTVTGKPHWGFTIKDDEQRGIPIPDELLLHLEEWRKAHPDSRLVLPTSGHKPNTKLLRTLKRLAKAYSLNCGVCAGCKGVLGECGQWTLHKLRRTYCTQLLRSGLDLATCQTFMGHSDIESTMRYLKPASSKESQARINSIKWRK